MAGRIVGRVAAFGRGTSEWKLLLYSLLAGMLALAVTGVHGGAVVFSVLAALAWRLGKNRALKWGLTVFAVLCVIAAVVVTIDTRVGTAHLTVF